jgi:hypothetical protein
MSELPSATSIPETVKEKDLSGPPAANRNRLPDERVGLTHHFSIAGHEGYLNRTRRACPVFSRLRRMPSHRWRHR